MALLLAIDLLFIHHSCGGQWLAQAAAERERATCVWVSHPNGGGLRERLSQAGFTVHEASYGSAVGEKTDLFDWMPKFRDQMQLVLRVDENDRLLPEGHENRVVVFKSCFPNSDFKEEGAAPGNPLGPELTVANAKAAFLALREVLLARPDVLFVYVTAPPLAPEPEPPAWRKAARFLKHAFAKPASLPLAESGRLAREFNRWVVHEWPRGNVVVFDYFDVLANDAGALQYPSAPGDSHPSAEGNQRAAGAFLPFLNAALQRTGARGAKPQ